MDASKVAVAVAGGATVSPDNLADLLSDWLMIDTEEERDFRFYLPADSALTTQVVVDTAEYLASIDAGYGAVTGNLPRRGRASSATQVYEDAEDSFAASEGVIDKLLDCLKADGRDPYLILAWGEDENGPDDETRELLSQALEAGIKVLDITAGLDDLSYDEEPAPEPVQLELPAPEQDEAQTIPPTPPTMAERDAERGHPDLATTLTFVYRHLDALDRAEAARDMQEHIGSPLTFAVSHHLSIAVAAELADASRAAEIAAEATPEPVESSVPKQRGKPRDISSDTVTTLHDALKRTIRIHPGKGRPRKGESKYEMLRAEYEAIKAQYELN